MGEFLVSWNSPSVEVVIDFKVVNIAIFVVTDTFSKWIAIITRK
jgi:hypothetical protein